MQGGKNWISPKEMNANRFFWDSHWLEICSNHLFPSMGPNGVPVAIDSRNSPPPHPPHLGSCTRALLVSQNRRHLFVAPWLIPTGTVDEVACMLGHLPSKAQDPASKFYKAPQQPVKGTHA
jgi:hypothetical protein